MLCRRQVLVRLERIAAIQPPWVVHTPTFNHPGRHVEKSVQRLDLDVQLLGNATMAFAAPGWVLERGRIPRKSARTPERRGLHPVFCSNRLRKNDLRSIAESVGRLNSEIATIQSGVRPSPTPSAGDRSCQKRI